MSKIMGYVPSLGKETIGSVQLVSKSFHEKTEKEAINSIIQAATKRDICNRRYQPNFLNEIDALKNIYAIASDKFDISRDYCEKLLRKDENFSQELYFNWYSIHLSNFSPIILEEQANNPAMEHIITLQEQSNYNNIQEAWSKTITLFNPTTEQEQKYHYIVYNGKVIPDIVSLLSKIGSEEIQSGHKKQLCLTAFMFDELLKHAEITRVIKYHPSVVMRDKGGNTLWFYKDIKDIFSENELNNFNEYINIRNNNGFTALAAITSELTHNENSDEITNTTAYTKMLLQHGANSNIENCSGIFPLYYGINQYLIRKNEIPELLDNAKILLQNGANSNIWYSYHQNYIKGPLLSIALYGKYIYPNNEVIEERAFNVINLLLTYGADPDPHNFRFTETPLYRASCRFKISSHCQTIVG
jgi:hypothetical protein